RVFPPFPTRRSSDLFTYGFSFDARYKHFDIRASFNGSQGNQVLDGYDYYLYNMEGSGNQYADVAQRYRSAENPGNGSVYRASRRSEEHTSELQSREN